MHRITSNCQIPPQMDPGELARVADKYRAVTFTRVEWESIEGCTECPNWSRTGKDADGEVELIYSRGGRQVRQCVCGGCLDEVLGGLVAKFDDDPTLRDSLIVRVLLDCELS